jgi:hypothetical protein
MSSPILTAFNNQFSEFMDDIISIFPENKDLITTKNMMTTLRKGNPRLLIQIWKNFINDPYSAEIEKGDITFFIDKDYGADIQKMNDTDKILKGIDRLRNPIKSMDKLNQNACMKYIQNMSKLSAMYFQNK